ncbi:hypothetical protein VTN02DRAFT_5085 [Thermoascus thermophilus]
MVYALFLAPPASLQIWLGESDRRADPTDSRYHRQSRSPRPFPAPCRLSLGRIETVVANDDSFLLFMNFFLTADRFSQWRSTGGCPGFASEATQQGYLNGVNTSIPALLSINNRKSLSWDNSIISFFFFSFFFYTIFQSLFRIPFIRSSLFLPLRP